MDKDIFAKLKVADIKALFETEQALEILPLAQEDTRSSGGCRYFTAYDINSRP